MALGALVLSRDEGVQEVLRKVLPDLGVQVEVSSGAESARQRLTAQKFEAVIIDLDDMPGALQFMEALRSIPSMRSAIVFAVTVLTDVKVAFQLGANFVLEKPLTVDRTLRAFRAAQGLIMRERRRYYRYPVSIPATVEAGNKSTTANITNLSEGGMAIDMAEPLAAGTIVKWSFDLPEIGERIEGKGEVTWTNASGNAGVSFVYMPQKFKTSLEQWLNVRAKSDEPAPLVVNANRIPRADL